MKQFVVVGGGWAGCAAALAAAKGAEGDAARAHRPAAGLQPGRDHAQQRPLYCCRRAARGAGELIAITDQCARHTGVNFPATAMPSSMM